MKMYGYLLLCLLSNPCIAFQFQDLEKAIKADRVRSVEDVLQLLPQPLLSNAILVFHSRSLQHASPETPRAMLYDSTGSFFLTFNGDASQIGGDEVEILERTSATVNTLYSIHFNNGRASIEKDPARCLTCHTGFGNALFDSNGLWPGVFGSFKRSSPLFPSEEKRRLTAFFEAAPNHDRYRHLSFSPEASTYESSVVRNRSFTQLIYKGQAERMVIFMKKASNHRIPVTGWTEPLLDAKFIEHLPQDIQQGAREAYAKAFPYLCRRILTSTSRRIKRQLTLNAFPDAKGRYPVTDLSPLAAIARAYAIASTLGVVDDFELLSNLTVDRHSYVSQDGAQGFWGYFFEAMSEGQPFPKALFSGNTPVLTYSNQTFSLAGSDPTCGSFHWP